MNSPISVSLEPASGDLDSELEPPRDIPSYIHNDRPQTREVPFKQLGQPIVRPVSRQLSNRIKEYTTQDRILQVKNGEFIINALKKSRNSPERPQYVSAPEIRNAIEVNYIRHHDGKLEMVNELQLKNQKQVLGHLVKEFGSALFTGKSIMGISLPVEIFEPQSQLERESRSLSYAPHFLEKGGNTNNTLEQFKLAIAHYIASLHLGTNPQKPFNPLLGETFQGKIGDCPVYVEQISHHPPKSALQLLGKSFRIEGLTESAAEISMNSVKSWKVGNMKIIYKNTNAVIRAQYPSVLMSGTAIGKRTFQFIDKFHIFDIENRYYTKISFGKKKAKHAKDQFSGAIWRINDSFAEKLKQAVMHSQDISNLKFKEKHHAVAQFAKIEGSWLDFLRIGGQIYWSFGAILPFKLQYTLNPLPSDSNFRLDILYLRMGDDIQSQGYKEFLEDRQRNDKKLRDQNLRQLGRFDFHY